MLMSEKFPTGSIRAAMTASIPRRRSCRLMRRRRGPLEPARPEAPTSRPIPYVVAAAASAPVHQYAIATGAGNSSAVAAQQQRDREEHQRTDQIAGEARRAARPGVR